MTTLTYRPGFVNYHTPAERALGFARGIDDVVKGACEGFGFVKMSDTFALAVCYDIIRNKANGNTKDATAELNWLESNIESMELILEWAGLSFKTGLGVTERDALGRAWRSKGTKRERVIKIMKFMEELCMLVGYAKEELNASV